MKRSLRISLLGSLMSVTFLACSSTPPSDAAASPAPAAAEPRGGEAGTLPDLASMFSGSYRGSSPGNELLLGFSTLGARTGTVFDVFVTASGRYRETNVRRVGALRLSTQGRDVPATYIPHFDATVTPLSRDATRFTEDELRAACTLYFSPAGDGFYGETRGSTSCAVAMPGATGKWTIEVDPAGIRIRSAQSGETLRFVKERKSSRRES